jgi:hypothetical protein
MPALVAAPTPCGIDEKEGVAHILIDGGFSMGAAD